MARKLGCVSKVIRRGVVGVAGIGDNHDEVGLPELLCGTGNALTLDMVSGVAIAGSIDEVCRNRANLNKTGAKIKRPAALCPFFVHLTWVIADCPFPAMAVLQGA